MGGKLGKRLVQRKSDFRGPEGTSTYDFGESTPPPRVAVPACKMTAAIVGSFFPVIFTALPWGRGRAGCQS